MRPIAYVVLALSMNEVRIIPLEGAQIREAEARRRR